MKVGIKMRSQFNLTSLLVCLLTIPAIIIGQENSMPKLSRFHMNQLQLVVNDVVAPEARQVYPYYVSSSVKDLHDELYRDVFEIIKSNLTFFNSQTARQSSPFKFRDPKEIRSVLDFTLPEKRLDHAALLDIIKKVIEYSPKASHPFKVFTLMEYALQKRVRELIGYPDGKGDGMTTPGAGMGNGYVVQLALRAKFPTLKDKGFVQASIRQQPVIFVSEHGSFVYEKYCIWEGIGEDACVRIKVDENGRMKISDLKSQIRLAKAYGSIPFLVVGTAGTPVLGAIDPLKEVAQVAKENGCWFHVDGQLSGANFLSPNQKNRLNGIENSDSFLFSADKGLAAPFVTSILVTRTEHVMNSTFGLAAPVVFRPIPLYNNSMWDNGDGTLQTTRRPDVLKLWFMWKAKGQTRLAQHIDHTYAITNQTVTELKSRGDGKAFDLLLNKFDSNQVAFYYIPRALRTASQTRKLEPYKEDSFAQKVKASLLRQNIMSISVNGFKPQVPEFFVMSLSNSVLTMNDVKYMLDRIESEAEKVYKQRKDTAESEDFEMGTDIEEKQLLPFWPTFWPFGPKTTTSTTAPPEKVIEVPNPPSSYPDYVSAPIESMHQNFFNDFFNNVLDYATYFETKRRTDPPLLWMKPEELQKAFDFTLTSPTGTMKENEEGLLNIFKNIVKYSSHLSHPYYNFQLVQALDPYTLMADYVLAAINSPTLTFEDNPAFTEMEKELTKAVRKRIGYPESGDGIVLPGGAAADEISVLLAHIRKIPDAKLGGSWEPKKTMVAFMSDGAHYSVNKGGFFNGIGLENVIMVDEDERGRMSVPALKAAVQKAKNENKIPFLVVATAGTTVLGAFDPIDEIADVCRDNGMWLHVDGSYGGSGIMSSNETRKAIQFKGLSRSDSFSFNPHKVFGCTKETTVFVMRQANVMKSVAPRIVSEQEFNNYILYDSKTNDPAINHLFTDRRANVFKMWFLWKAKGLEGLGLHIDYGYNLTAQVQKVLESRSSEFILAHPGFPSEGPSVNFYYVPERLRNADRTKAEFWEDMKNVQNKIFQRVVESDRLVVSNEPVGNHNPYLVMSLYNSALTLEDAIYMLDVIADNGRSL